MAKLFDLMEQDDGVARSQTAGHLSVRHALRLLQRSDCEWLLVVPHSPPDGQWQAVRVEVCVGAAVCCAAAALK